MNGVGGLAGWRWIFILEGILTVVIAVIAFFTLHDFPATAKFLTEEERAFVVYRLKYQGSKESGQMIAESDRFKWKYVIDAFTDWQIYLSLFSKPFVTHHKPPGGRPAKPNIVYWGIVCPLYGISFFLPTIINELGYTSSTAQLLTM